MPDPNSTRFLRPLDDLAPQQRFRHPASSYLRVPWRVLKLRGSRRQDSTRPLPDIRNSKVIDVVRELNRVGIAVQVHDPLALSDEVRHEYGVALCPLDALKPADGVVLAVAHDDYLAGGWPFVIKLLKGGQGIVLDVKSKLDRSERPQGVDLWRL